MKKQLTAAVLLMWCLTGSAVAGVETLETFGTVENVEISSFHVDGMTITLSSESTAPFTLRAYYSSAYPAFSGASDFNVPLNEGNISMSHFISTVINSDPSTYFYNAIPIVFEFSTGVCQFGFTALDLMENGAEPSEYLELRAYDMLDNIIDSFTITGPQGPSGLDLQFSVSSSGNDIVRAKLNGVVNAAQGGFGIDDILVGRCTAGVESSWSGIKTLYR